MSDSDSEWESQQRTLRQVREFVNQKKDKAVEEARKRKDNASVADAVAALAPSTHKAPRQFKPAEQPAPRAPTPTVLKHERPQDRPDPDSLLSEAHNTGLSSEESVTSPDPMDIDPPRPSTSNETFRACPLKRKSDSSLPLGKIRKKPRPIPSSDSTSNDRHKPNGQAQPPVAAGNGSSATGPTVRPGLEWYSAMARSARRIQAPGVDMSLGKLKTSLQKCQLEGGPAVQDRDLEKLLTEIHDAMFLPVNAQLLRDHRLLFDQEGLPTLFDPTFMRGRTYPFYLQADAEELYYKWSAKDFETDLLRGLRIGKGKNEALGRDKATADSIDPRYAGRKRGNFFGSKPTDQGWSLVNGQWWPTQLCTVRDGAHYSAQGGISGKDGQGAWSCILSGDPKYPDRDEGDEIWYCGTDGSNGEKTDNTKYMIANVASGNPVRLLRSAKCKNRTLAPAQGFRYDGVYDVKSYEILDQELQRHRFHLVRQPGQHPIRAGDGPEARPTAQELREYKRIQGERQFLV